jgi:hypothetical protein
LRFQAHRSEHPDAPAFPAAESLYELRHRSELELAPGGTGGQNCPHIREATYVRTI